MVLFVVVSCWLLSRAVLYIVLHVSVRLVVPPCVSSAAADREASVVVEATVLLALRISSTSSVVRDAQVYVGDSEIASFVIRVRKAWRLILL